jgi:hypothetical protein
MWASKMLHHSYDIFVHNLKKLFDYFLTSFHCTTGKLNSPVSRPRRPGLLPWAVRPSGVEVQEESTGIKKLWYNRVSQWDIGQQ